MASNIQIKISNLDRIVRAFEYAPSVMRRELNNAIRRSLLGILAQSKRNTPVLTGRLRASEYTLFSDLSGVVSTNTDYAIYVHEGTRFMEARPFLSDAVLTQNESTQRYFEKAVDSALDKIAGGI